MKRDWESKAFRQSEGGIVINHYAAVQGFVGRNRNTEKEEMNKTKFRCLSLALAIGVVALLTSGVAIAQTHTTGINVTKSCPSAPVDVGTPITCSYTITNIGDTAHGYTIQTATETAPCTADMTGVCQGPSGTPFDILTPSATNSGCLQGDPPAPVTVLGPAGTATASCSGTFVQVAPSTCNPEPTTIVDKVQVSGTDAGQVLPPFGNFATNIINVNGEVCNEGEFCRTAGFWSTHTGSGDKACAQNITQAVLDAGGPLNICGELICNTEVDDASSAVEAMCVAVQGQQERQLARQLTAAALNCIVTNGSADCTGVSIADAFAACNTICANNVDANPDNNVALGDCIAEIDCFNNGGVWDGENDFCATGTCSNDSTQGCNQDDLSNCAVGAECVPLPNNCHEAEFGDFENVTLPNDLLPDTDPCFEHQGPADNADCKGAKKTDCTVIPPGESACDDESSCVLD